MSLNKDLGKTQITDRIRVSSACVFLTHIQGGYYQYETWIFKGGGNGSRQIIVGSWYRPSDRLEEITKRLHGRISKLLLKSLPK